MSTHYTSQHWNTPLPERVSAAELLCRRWKQIKEDKYARFVEERSRQGIVFPASTIDPASAYAPIDPAAPNLKFKQPKIAPGKSFVFRMSHEKSYWREYLNAFQKYMEAKLELDRLAAELRAQRDSRPKRPATAGRAKLDTPRGPLGRNDESAADPAPPSERTKLDAMREEALRKMHEAASTLTKTRTEKAVVATLHSMAEVQLTGGSEPETAKEMNLVGDVLEEHRDKAEATFRRTPTADNLKEWIKKDAGAQFAGRDKLDDPHLDQSKNQPMIVHPTVKGDTLSKLARHYYGDVSLWYLIYRENLATEDPDHLPIGVPLSIPWVKGMPAEADRE